MTKLSRATLDDLMKSGIDSKSAKKMQIRDILPDEMVAIYIAAYKKRNLPIGKNLPNVHAYEIPYFDLEGNVIDYARYKLLEEYIPNGSKKAAKYLQLIGTKPKFYFPPFCDWGTIAADSNREIFFVEGEKKAVALTILGFPAIGLGGIWSWKSKEDESSEPISDFNLINWEHRKTFVVFDADV